VTAVDRDLVEAAEADRSLPAGEAEVLRVVVEVDGMPMSALVSRVPRPRAVIVALHGGAAMSAYFDDREWPRHSLLRIGAALGYTVLAPDRPGYGSSSPYADQMVAPARRVDLAYAVVDRLLGSDPRGAGLFLLGHSAGSALVLGMAADDERARDVLGIEIAGTGLHHHSYMRGMVEERRLDPGSDGRVGRGLYDLLWRHEGLYPADVVGGARFASRTPGYELQVGQGWSRDFPALAARIRVPVRYSLGDHEQVWSTGPEALAEVAGLFTAAPRVDTDELAVSGHNLSVGLTATAYHLKVLAFVEECVAARLRARGSETDE